MELGALMDRLASGSEAATALEALGDIVLFAEVQAMGARYDEDPGEYVANATRRFAAQGSDEDWLSLMTVMERSDDPARAALEQMLRWSLKHDAAETQPHNAGQCSCGGVAADAEDANADPAGNT
jgi:hypothetical protein